MSQVLASHCCTKVVTVSLLAAMCRQGSRFESLAVVLSSMVVDNDYQRLETASHGMETSKKWGLRSPTKSERNHNELFCSHQIFNMLKICQGTRRIISAACGRYRIRQRQLTATHDDWRQIQNCNSQLNVACRSPIRHSVSQALVTTIRMTTWSWLDPGLGGPGSQRMSI